MTGRHPRIVILTHSHDGFWLRPNLMHWLLDRWRSVGYEVRVVTERTSLPAADVAILHVNLTVIPQELRERLVQYQTVINGSVLDISKRTFSTLEVRDSRAITGPVIVKTNLNYRGVPECRSRVSRSFLCNSVPSATLRSAVGRALTWSEYRRPWRYLRVLDGYPVFSSSLEVPSGVWNNRNLVVERFEAEREGSSYVCRHWLFMGSREVQRITRSLDPMVKLNADVAPLADAVPDELRDTRRQLKFDYGKFDYGIVSGRVVLYDVNRTPGATRQRELHADTVNVLADGVLDYVSGS